MLSGAVRFLELFHRTLRLRLCVERAFSGGLGRAGGIRQVVEIYVCQLLLTFVRLWVV